MIKFTDFYISNKPVVKGFVFIQVYNRDILANNCYLCYEGYISRKCFNELREMSQIEGHFYLAEFLAWVHCFYESDSYRLTEPFKGILSGLFHRSKELALKLDKVDLDCVSMMYAEM